MIRNAACCLAALTVANPAMSASMPDRLDACTRSTIAKLEHRLQGGNGGQFVPDSGSAVRFANGGYQVSYSEIEAVHNSKVGDPVLICLVLLPSDCPRGDTRGKVFTTTNLRTLESWTMPDAEHSCGGA
jgi:hypothetical protein